MASITEKQRRQPGLDADLTFSYDGGNQAATTTTNTVTAKTNDGSDNNTNLTRNASIQYDVEHLATFSTASSQYEQATSDGDNGGEPTTANNKSKFKQTTTTTTTSDSNEVAPTTEPKVALQKLFELEKLSGIWTQRMQIDLQNDVMLILDCETNSIVERFHYDRVTKPEAFNHYNDIYNNIIVFIIDQKGHNQVGLNQENCDNIPGELHIFQCVSHDAKQLVSDILEWKSSRGRKENGTENPSVNPSSTNGLQVSCLNAAVDDDDDDAGNKSTAVPSDAALKPNSSASLEDKKEPKQNIMSEASDHQKLQDVKKEATSSETKDPQATTTTTTGKLDSQQSTTVLKSEADEMRRPRPAVIVANSSNSSETVPIVNVNVKETVQVFNQIAALREKSSGTISQTTRPLSDASNSSQNASAAATTAATTATQQQQQTTDGTTAVLSAGGQFYKQRSIRVTLAPKGSHEEQAAATEQTTTATQQQQPARPLSPQHSKNSDQTQPTSSSCSPMTSLEQQRATKSSNASSSVSSSSRSDNNNQHNDIQGTTATPKKNARDSDPSQVTLASSNNHHPENVDSQFLPQQQQQQQQQLSQKQIAIQSQFTKSSNSHTQSNLSSNHLHNNQQHQHQQPSGTSKTSNNNNNSKISSSSSSSTSRPPASTGHHNSNNNSSNHHQQQHHHHHHHHNHHGGKRTSATFGAQSSDSSGRSRASPLPPQEQLEHQALEQVNTNESYVSVLNHCFDDIEKFIIRLQHAHAAVRELQAQKKQTRRSSGAASATALGGHSLSSLSASKTSHHHVAQNGAPLPLPPTPLTAAELAMLSAQARGPSADDFFEILSKFKLAFNLLAKLKGCIHEPNAPELVHFLFTPLAIIIESARNVSPPVDPTDVSIPYLNKDALDLLSNCCTSKESDLWLSLGSNWTQTIDVQLLKASRLPSSFQPIFSDGWAPVISELELIGLVVPPPSPTDVDHYHQSGVHANGGGGKRAGHRSQDNGAPLMIKDSSHGGRKLHTISRNARGEPLESSVKSSSSSSGAYDGGTNGSHMAPPLVGKPNKKRIAPKDSLGTHMADPNSRAGYAPGGHHHPSDQVIDPLVPYTDGLHPSSAINNSYRAPELQPVGRHAHRSARMSMPASERSHRTTTTSSSRHMSRNSEYHPSYGHYAPPLANGTGFLGDSHDLQGYPSYAANPSDDYTELQESAPLPSQHTTNGHYLPTRPSGGGGAVGGDYLSSHYVGAPGVRTRRKGSRSSNFVAAPPYEHQRGGGGGGGGQYPTEPLPPPVIYDDDTLLISEAEQEAMLLDIGPAQTEWFYELKSRGALIVRVLFTREANNDKELTVRRGEILEVLDDTRKWWKARNINLQVAYVPHTIVAIMENYQTLDELLTNSPGGGGGGGMMMINEDPNSQALYARQDEHNSKTAKGAFRYF